LYWRGVGTSGRFERFRLLTPSFMSATFYGGCESLYLTPQTFDFTYETGLIRTL
jgi:hypothetical protein